MTFQCLEAGRRGGWRVGPSQELLHGYYGPHPAAFHRRLVVTETGYLGLEPENVRTADLVTIMMGSQVPLVLREVRENYLFVGNAFIDGIMDGEALAERKEDERNVVFRIQ